MIKSLRILIFLGGLAIVVLGLVIMLLLNDTGKTPENLVTLVTWLNFVVGTLLILYMVKKRGIN